MQVVRKVLDTTKFEIDRILHGGAQGVDQFVDIWCHENSVETDVHPIPDWAWDQVGSKAGPLRNSYMVERADAVVAIWDGESPGTLDVIKKSDARGLPLRKVICKRSGASWEITDDQYVESDQAQLGEFE